MNVYKVTADLAYGQLTFACSERKYSSEEKQISEWDKEFSRWRRLCETTGWVPPRLEGSAGGGRARTLPLDCISAALGSGRDMLLNAHARATLAPLLLPCGDYLPVQVAGLDYQIFNCTAEADVADDDRIEGKHCEIDGETSDRWNEIDRWSFHPQRVAAAPAVFTVPQVRFM